MVDSNTILFNGYISSEPVDVGGGFIAFNIEGGESRMEMPLILSHSTLNEFKSNFQVNDLISAYGQLEKVQEQWVIKAKEIMRIPSDDELKEMK